MQAHDISVSVAMCTYNGALYLLQQLDSILQQSRLPDEIVICDDGSTDGTLQIIHSFAKSSPVPVRIVVNTTNLGFISNFEQAIQLCKGDLILLSDQDDVWYENRVEVTVAYFRNNPSIEVIFANASLIRDEVITQETIWSKVGFNSELTTQLDTAGVNPLLRHMLLKGAIATGATMAMTQSAKVKYLPFFRDGYHYHDAMLALRSACDGTLGVIREKLIAYRIHEHQVIGVGMQEKSSGWGTKVRKLFRVSWSSEEKVVLRNVRLLSYLIDVCENKASGNFRFLSCLLQTNQKRLRLIKANFFRALWMSAFILLRGEYRLLYPSANWKKYIIKDILS